MTASNSFEGTNIMVGNTGVRAVIDEIMGFRTQITYKSEIRAEGGWNDPLNQLLAEGLGRIRETLALVTHDQLPAAASAEDATSSSAGQGERQLALEAQAKDEDLRLVDLYNAGKPIAADNVQMPANRKVQLPYDFSGADPRYPQLHGIEYKNVFLKQFVSILDLTVHNASNVASSGYGDTLPENESTLIHARLNQAFTILQVKGGAIKRPNIADGTDPSSTLNKVGPEVLPVVPIT